MSALAGNPEIRLLGVPDFWNGADNVVLTGRVCDLTLLLVASRPGWITRDEAIDRLWGGKPRPSSASALRTYLVEIRSLLGQEAIEAFEGSIRLASSVQTDVDRLAEVLRRAEQLVPTAPADAQVLLRQVVASFSAEVMVGVDLEALQGLRAGIDRMRLMAEDLLVESIVRSGVSANDIGLVRKLAEEQPFREVRAKGLMVALTHLGQRRDALAVFQDLSRRLREETGLAPGADLRAAEREILLADSATPLASISVEPLRLRRADIVRRATELGWTSVSSIDQVVSVSLGDTAVVEQLLRLSDHDPFFVGGPLPAFLSAWIAERIGRLNEAELVILRLVALEPESMTSEIARQAARTSLTDVSTTLAGLVAKGVIIRRMDTTLRFANELFRLHIVGKSSDGSLNELRVHLAGLPSLSNLKRLWHHAAIVGLSDDLLSQLASSVGTSFETAAVRKTASTVREICAYLMSPESAELNPVLVIQFLATSANVLDLAGLASTARKVRNFAVNLALRRNDAVSAAQILVGPAATGRTYHADAEVASLMDRALSLMPSTGYEALSGQLRAERLCREVMQNGSSELALEEAAGLRALSRNVGDLDFVSSVERALLHVDLVRPGPAITVGRFDRARKAVFASKNYDAATDILTMESTCALARGDVAGWEESIAEFEAYCVRIARPSELWSRELLWATDLQRRGQLRSADEKAVEARELGSSFECADHDIAFRVHRLSSRWQRRDFSGLADETGDELALLSQLMDESFRSSPVNPALHSMVEFVDAQMRDHPPSLATLPTLAILSQLCWNWRAERHAPFLANALAEYAVDIVVVGLIPVTCFGPIARYNAQLCALLGREREAERFAEKATSVAQRARCVGWEALALADHSEILSMNGRHAEAEILRHSAVVRRASLR